MKKILHIVFIFLCKAVDITTSLSNNICFKNLVSYKYLPVSDCNEYINYFKYYDGQHRIDHQIITNNKQVYKNNNKLLKPFKQKEINLRFNNLNIRTRKIFINWLINLPMKELHQNHINEIKNFIDLSVNLSYDIIVCNQHDQIRYAIIGEVNNDLLFVKSIIQNYKIMDNELSFIKIKPELINYLNNCTSNIKDLNLEYIKNSSYKRYLFTI